MWRALKERLKIVDFTLRVSGSYRKLQSRGHVGELVFWRENCLSFLLQFGCRANLLMQEAWPHSLSWWNSPTRWAHLPF